MTKILMTGMSGLIGGLLRTRLEEAGGYELTALNRRPVAGVECVQADIADLDAIRPAFGGKDVVVHLAARIEDDPWEEMLRANVIGTYNVFEAARLAGVRRVVFASSGSTIRGFDLVPPYDALSEGRYEDAPASWPMLTHDMVRPQGLYGASKVWGEALARHFSDAHDMSILCVRLGTVTADDRPPEKPVYSAFVSHRDTVDILHRSIDASDDLKFEIYFATSRDRWGYRDLDHTRDVLGFEPQDSVEDFRVEKPTGPADRQSDSR
jgi:nucleoside-diphosphate-sugar epimerase